MLYSSGQLKHWFIYFPENGGYFIFFNEIITIVHGRSDGLGLSATTLVRGALVTQWFACACLAMLASVQLWLNLHVFLTTLWNTMATGNV